jgi:TatD DNase family protein
MLLIDTHTHLYLDNFTDDRDEVVKRAINQGVSKMLLPAIDRSTFEDMINLSDKYPENCLPMIGLHPTSVKDGFEAELKFVEDELQKGKYIAIGETGIDLYWDSTFSEQQKFAFTKQLRWAKKYKLPIVIHTRDSFNEVYNIVNKEKTDDLNGVFHCFTGTLSEAYKIMDIGFYMGIGGIITFKNSGLAEVCETIPSSSLVLETDSPFLTPVPYRGKRNESSYLNYIASKLADSKRTSASEIIDITTQNANNLFNLK